MKKSLISNARAPKHSPCGNVSSNHPPKQPYGGAGGSNSPVLPHIGQIASAILVLSKWHS